MNQRGISELVARLVRLLAGERAEEVLGDLAESYEARAARLGKRSARRWVWRELIALMAWRLGWKSRTDRARVVHDDEESTTGGWTMWGHDFMQDVRFAVRTLSRKPGFTAVAVLVLGLGIGAPTTVLSLVDRIFFERPAEVEEPHRLVRVYRAWEGGGGGSLRNPDYEYLRDNNSTLAGLGAYTDGGLIASYSLDGVSYDQLRVARASANFFDVLGVEPALGREFTPEENQTPGTDPVAVLSHDFWERAFGADPDAVGRSLTLNGRPYTVIGVLPEAFRGINPGRSTGDIWVPIAMTGELERHPSMAWWKRLPNLSSSWLNVVGRLAPGVSFEAAEQNLVQLHRALEYEGRDEEERLWVRKQFLYSPRTANQLAGLTRILLGVVGIVLVIAAANVAVLLLSRASSREREIGVRSAMGAGRWRITRQLVAESLVLGVAGGAVGIAIAYLTADLAAALMPVSFEGSFAPDGGVIVLAVLLAALTSAVVGLVPALHVNRGDLRSALQEGSSRTGRSRTRSALVVGQLALSVTLVAGAFLFVRSFRAASNQEVGFETKNRLVVRVPMRALGFDEARGRAFVEAGLERIEALPGVTGVSTTTMLPFSGEWTSTIPAPPGATPNGEGETIDYGMNVVSPGYFHIMGMDVLQGRSLDEQDTREAPLAVVVNETFAEDVWPEGEAVGRTLPVRDDESATVVGVVADANYYELGEEPRPHLWASTDQSYQGTVNFLIQTALPTPGFIAPIQQALREVEPTVAFSNVTTLEEQVSQEVATYEVTAVLVGLFGGLALLLASVGLYGVVSFLVARRTREIGVRMALGAGRDRVAREVMVSGGRLALMGVLLGLIGAVALRRFVGSFLYRVRADDPLALLGAVVVLVSVALLASLAPALRATRVDPMVAMRAE